MSLNRSKMASHFPLSAKPGTIPDNLSGIDSTSLSLAIKLCYGLLSYEDSAYGSSENMEQLKTPLRELFPFLQAIVRSVQSYKFPVQSAKIIKRSIDSCDTWIEMLQEKMYKHHIPARDTDRYRDAPKTNEPLKGGVIHKISVMIQNIRDNIGPALEILRL
jgi:hypothetical protein